MSRLIHQPYDKFVKQSMANIRVAREFFQIYLPKELLEMADLSTLKLQKQSFIDEAYKTHEADILYSVTLNNSQGYFYLLTEHQSAVDKLMAFRLLGYIVQIIQLHLKQHPKSPLPIVYPLVIYAGEKRWTAPLSLFDLFGQNADLAQKFFLQPYELIDIVRLSDDQLQQHDWFGLVEFILKHRQISDFARYLETLLPWLQKIEASGEGVSFAKIVLRYLIKDLETNNEKLLLEKVNTYLSEELRGEVMTLAQRFEQIGMQRAERNERTTLCLLLRQKFNTIPPHYQSLLERAESDTLLAWTSNILQANTIEEVFAADH